ncbi:hypothetical protein SAY86_025219 [Trapa natans]|uniref:Uncharacterized protein n=1 Tax=Trapa natans TaxID=22666 RepID=A0AAN7M6S6_TRANT|nr:hypothetical protein SAY86_025219 [Trapa natans]
MPLDQQRSVRAFLANLNNFISGFSMFEQTNYEFEFQKLERDQMFFAMKKSHKAHLLKTQLLEALTEGQELKKRMDEVNSRMEKLISVS